VSTAIELRSIVRTQTQTDASDLPDATIDAYLQQAFERTINGETQWPFYAQTWDLLRDAASSTLVLPGDVNPPGIMSLTNKDSGARLGMVPHEYADSNYLGLQATSGGPMMYSVWGDTLYFWPAPAGSSDHRKYHLRGYRKPVEWLTPEGSPDCDPRLHLAFTHYACALAYAQQEDESLEATYMQRWQQDAELARRAIMEPVHHRPFVMGGSIRYSGREFVPTGYIVTTPP
jgi:hypothetical protein